MTAQLIGGKPFIPYWPPGMALYLAPFVASGAGDVVLRASILPFWALCCWALYRLLQIIGCEGIAWLVLLVFSLLPDSIQMSIEPMTQMPVAALFLTSMAAAVRALRRPAPSGYILLGTSLGLMALVRPSAILLTVLLPAACFLVTRRPLPALLSTVLSLTMLGTWMAHAHTLTGRWIINTANASNLFYGNNPWTPPYRTWYLGSHAKLGSAEIAQLPGYEHVLLQVSNLPPLQQSSAFQQLALAEIRQHPAGFLLRTANRVRAFFGFDIFTSAAVASHAWAGVNLFPIVLGCEALIYFFLVATSLFWLAAAPRLFWRDPGHWIILAAIILYAAPYWISMSHPTYHFPVLLPLAALGAKAWRISATHPYHRARGWIAIAALSLVQIEWIYQMAAVAP